MVQCGKMSILSKIRHKGMGKSKNVRNTSTGRFTRKSDATSDPKGTVSETRATRAKSKQTCDSCSGTGLNQLDDTQLCDQCNGTGKVE